MCRTTESLYAKVFLCQPYYASDEGEWFVKQRKMKELEWGRIFENCMHDVNTIRTSLTKTDCEYIANKIVRQRGD